MPFGLPNAPATFETIMNNILREFMNLRVVVSIDNIVVFSKSEMKHHVLVVNILQQLCSWLKTEYLQLERRPPGF